MKIVFMGTPEFAVPTLLRLVEDRHEICSVYTQPDKPKGRGYAMQPPPVKEAALSRDIPVLQPQSMKDPEVWNQLAMLTPDLIIVVAYGKLLPVQVLEIPKYGCINVHASLLPKYRGAAPIQWSVINGETTTGVTTMMMEAGLDTGDMLLKAETPIGEDETSGQLHDRLSQMGARLCSDTVRFLEEGRLQRIKQDDRLACYAPMLTRELSAVDWNWSAKQVHDRIRGLSPWPGASTVLDGKRIKLHRSRLSDHSGGSAGEILSEQPLLVACGDGKAVELVEIQCEGGKRMKASDFVRGHRLPPGTRFGGTD